jgi:hypothetical protein
MELDSSRRILNKYQISNFTKICPVGNTSSHVYGRIDRQTDANDWANSRSCQFLRKTRIEHNSNMKGIHVFCGIIKSNRNLFRVQK